MSKEGFLGHAGASRRRLTRREFLAASTAAAGGLWLTACTTGGPRPTVGRSPMNVAMDTRWPIKRVVYLMLENRSFDHLFGRFPGARGARTGIRDGREVPLTTAPQWLPADPPHDLEAARQSHRGGTMDGFAQGPYGDFAYTQFRAAEVPNYWHWAQNYVLCDNFFASAWGPSYHNHLYAIAGQAGGAIDNPENVEVRRDAFGIFKSWGCDAYGDDVYVRVVDEEGNISRHPTCFDFPTVGEQLSDRNIDWVFYAPEPYQAGYIWSAYTSIKNVFHNEEMWNTHIWPVDELLADIRAAALPAVTWIVPRYQLSDHPPFSTCFAQNWVTDIVNGIMESSMWSHTAIFITWDEWGGFYDHFEPPQVDLLGLGFRVPMLVVSPFARRGYVDDAVGEFTTPLRFIADNWDLPYLTQRFELTHNFEHVFDFDRPPRPPMLVPRIRDCYGQPFRFPEGYGGWPEGTEPHPPQIVEPPEGEPPWS